MIYPPLSPLRLQWRIMQRSFALAGQLTRYREAFRLTRRGGISSSAGETIIQVSGPGGRAEVVLDDLVPAPLPIGVDVDDVRAEVYVVLTWGEPPAIEPGVQVVYETTGTEQP